MVFALLLQPNSKIILDKINEKLTDSLGLANSYSLSNNINTPCVMNATGST